MTFSGKKGSRRKNVSFRKSGSDRKATPSGSAGAGPGAGDAGESTAAVSHRAHDAVPELRVEKVVEIQSAMDSGTYRVEGEEVAEKMVSDAVREIRSRTR